MAKGFKINGVDFDDIFEPARSGFDSVTFAGLSPACSYMARTGGASNPNAAGYWKYNGVAYDAHPKGYMVPKSISVTTSPSTTSYVSGSTFNPAGMVVTATYQDDSTGNVTSSCIFTNTVAGYAGTQAVGISYTYNGVTRTTSFNMTVTAYNFGTVSATMNFSGTSITLPINSSVKSYTGSVVLSYSQVVQGVKGSKYFVNEYLGGEDYRIREYPINYSGTLLNTQCNVTTSSYRGSGSGNTTMCTIIPSNKSFKLTLKSNSGTTLSPTYGSLSITSWAKCDTASRNIFIIAQYYDYEEGDYYLMGANTGWGYLYPTLYSSASMSSGNVVFTRLLSCCMTYTQETRYYTNRTGNITIEGASIRANSITSFVNTYGWMNMNGSNSVANNAKINTYVSVTIPISN